MFLQALTLKGFKSFAETTTIDLAPGLSVIVGPNGSGKSNIVDAISWVLGSQSPTALRSQQMEDVIFAGNPGRAALGRAEVTLTFDNADRRLPLDLDEVAISRTLFRSGDSAYAINATQTRLIDIAEMLSAAGVGRHRHVIVSQGHIDAVLQAKPAERRAILEEAAGVSAYRVRKEKALRRLSDTEANLARLGDQLNEVRRALRPLEQQASVARRHGALAAELAALQIHRLGAELGELRERRRRAATRRRDLSDRRAAAGRELAALDGRIATAEARLSAPDHVALATAGERLATLEDRVQQAQRAISRRRAGLRAPPPGMRWPTTCWPPSARSPPASRPPWESWTAPKTELAAERSPPRRRRLGARWPTSQAQAARSEAAGATLESAETRRAEAAATETAAERARAAAAGECNRWRARVDALALTLGDERARAGMEVLGGDPRCPGGARRSGDRRGGLGGGVRGRCRGSPGGRRSGRSRRRPAGAGGAGAGAGPPARCCRSRAPGAGPPPVGQPLRPARARPGATAWTRCSMGSSARSSSCRPGRRPATPSPTHPDATDRHRRRAIASHRTGWRVGVHPAGAAGDALAESRERLASAEAALAEADRALDEAAAAATEAAGRLAEVQRSVAAAEAPARAAAAELQRRRSDLDAERRSLDRRASEANG